MFWNRKLSWSMDPIVPRCMGFLPAFIQKLTLQLKSTRKKKKKLRSHDSYCYGLGKSQLPKRRKYLENKTNETVILRLIERALALRPLGYIQPNLQRGDGQMEGTGDIPQNVPWSGTGSLAQTNSLCKTYQIM